MSSLQSQTRSVIGLEDQDGWHFRPREDLIDNFLDAPGDVDRLATIATDIYFGFRGPTVKFVAVAKVIAIITMADIPAVGSEDERRVRAVDMSERQGGLRIRRNSGELIEQEKRSIPGLCEQIATISFWQQSLK